MVEQHHDSTHSNFALLSVTSLPFSTLSDAGVKHYVTNSSLMECSANFYLQTDLPMVGVTNERSCSQTCNTWYHLQLQLQFTEQELKSAQTSIFRISLKFEPSIYAINSNVVTILRIKHI